MGIPTQQSLPRRQRRDGHRQGIGFVDYQSGGPENGGDDHQQHADGGTAQLLQFSPDQQRHATHAQDQTGQPAAGQRLIEKPDREQRTPEWHGVAENGGAPRRTPVLSLELTRLGPNSLFGNVEIRDLLPFGKRRKAQKNMNPEANS